MMRFIKLKSWFIQKDIVLREGDIIWAKRYKTENQKNKIEIGHRESPYVVIHKQKRQLFVLQCSSNPHNEIDWNILFYPLGRLLYDLDKNTYVKTSTSYLLSKEQYIKILSHLNKYDFNKLKKYVYIIMNSKYLSNHLFASYQLKWKYEEGDIINYRNHLYYIYRIGYKNYYVYKIYEKSKAQNRIKIHNRYYTFQFHEKIKIKRYHKIKLIDTLHSGEIEMIKQYQEDIRNQTKHPIEITKGCLMEYQNQYFYIEDENEKQYIVYKIYPSHNHTPQMKSITIKEGTYYTMFEKMTFSKTIEWKYRRKAYNNEILENKKLFSMKKNMRNKVNQI